MSEQTALSALDDNSPMDPGLFTQGGSSLGGQSAAFQAAQRQSEKIRDEVAKLSEAAQKAFKQGDQVAAKAHLVKLQDLFVKRQHVLTTLTNITKTLHDQTASMIRNIRG